MPEVIIAAIHPLTPRIREIQMERLDGGSTAFSPGAHLDLHLPNGFIRSYSLVPCDTASRFVVAVMRESDSRGGSSYLHEQLAVGDRLTVTEPTTTFAIHPAPEYALFAGGIGITPLLSIADWLHQAGRPFRLHYSVRTAADAAYLGRLTNAPWSARMTLYDGAIGARVDFDGVLGSMASDAALYACGPPRYLEALESAVQVRGLPSQQLHVERFRQTQLETAGGALTITCMRSGLEIAVAPDETILTALQRAGIDVPYACEEGICGTCMTDVLAGQVDHRDSFLTPEEQASHRVMAVCCSRGLGDRLTLDL